MNTRPPFFNRINLLSPLASLSCFLLALALGAFPTTASAAENPPNPDSPQSKVLPTPIPTQSPIDFFRRLLAMTPEERDKALASKTPAQRAVLRLKIDEYGEMEEMKRELRLHLLQLRIYLLPLMKLATDQRQEWMEYVPTKDRQIIQTRLEEWDGLSLDHQQQILQNQASLHYFLYRRPRIDTTKIMPPILPARSQQVEQAVQRWRNMPEAKRQEITGRLDNLFTSDQAQRQEILKTLLAPQRSRMEQILNDLAPYPADQRAVWVTGFQKFAGLTREERSRFLVQADRWKKMTLKERNLWRLLGARRSSPPWPPGLTPPTPSPLATPEFQLR